MRKGLELRVLLRAVQQRTEPARAVGVGVHRGERGGQRLGGGGLGHLRSGPGLRQRGQERAPQLPEGRDEPALEVLHARGERVGDGGELKRGLDALLAGDSHLG